jgi:hypothetical protein
MTPKLSLLAVTYSAVTKPATSRHSSNHSTTALWRKSGLKGKFGGNQQVVLATQSPWERSQASFPSSHCLDQTRSPSVVITADAISPAHRVSDCYSVEGDQLPGANVSRDLLTWMPSYPQRSKGRRFPGASLGGRICLKKPELLRYQMQKLITTVQNFGSTRFSPECSQL